jgi:thioester reductase-like protein
MNSTQPHDARGLPTQKLLRPYLLLTGGTGLVGQYLLKDFLSADQRIAVIVRPGKKLNESQRIESIMQRWERQLNRSLPRPVVLSGNINQPLLGLNKASQRWVADHCYGILHNAAVLQFAGRSKLHEPWFTNLGGTENVLAAGKTWGIRHFHYVSTAYVCGKRTQVVSESELDIEQEFRNDYERSKFEAEKLVADADHFDSKTIYRPAVIVGDSKTGFTSTYHGLFLYLRIFATLVPAQKTDPNGVHQTPIELPINGDEPRNLVPVDWVSEVIYHLVTTTAAHGRTYHLVPDQCSTARQFIDACCEHYNSGGVEFVGPEQSSSAATTGNSNQAPPKQEHSTSPKSEFAQLFFENARVYEQYLTTDPLFDKSNLERWAGHLRCPTIDAAMIQRFITFGEQNRWGKGRPKPPQVDRWFGQQLDQLSLIANRVFANLPSMDWADEDFASPRAAVPPRDGGNIDDGLIASKAISDAISSDRKQTTERPPTGNSKIEVGLDISGQGGGQWTLMQNEEGRFGWRMGLPKVGQPTLKIESSRLARLLDEFDQMGHATKGKGQQWDLLTEQIEAAISLSRVSRV